MLSAALPSRDTQKLAAFPDSMSRKEAARYLTALGYRITPKTLTNMASNNNKGKGPPYTRTGWNHPVSYSRFDLDAWFAARTRKVAVSTPA
jgi:hypothetical protein